MRAQAAQSNGIWRDASGVSGLWKTSRGLGSLWAGGRWMPPKRIYARRYPRMETRRAASPRIGPPIGFCRILAPDAKNRLMELCAAELKRHKCRLCESGCCRGKQSCDHCVLSGESHHPPYSVAGLCQALRASAVLDFSGIAAPARV